MGSEVRWLKMLYIFALIVCSLPLIMGLISTLAPAFSWLPVLGLSTPSLESWYQLFTHPGIWQSIGLSLFITLCSTLLTLIFTFSLLTYFYHSRYWRLIMGALGPVFALPHVAFSIGFVFLFAPSGWLFRLFSGVIDSPWVLVNDSLGLGISLVIAIKSTPFLMLMSLTPLQQLRTDKLLTLGASLGYEPAQVWYKIILPLWLSHLRLPVAAIIGYAISVVDISLILAPLRPAPLAVQIWEWIREPNLALLPVAGSASILLLLIALLILILFRTGEYLLMHSANGWQFNGARLASLSARVVAKITPLLYLLLTLIPLLAVVVLSLWSFTFRWRFPHLLPQTWTLKFWHAQWESISSLLSVSIGIALISTLISLFFAIICLEFADRSKRGLPILFIVIPLVVPQIGLLFGVRIITLYLPNLDYLIAVIWGHILFVFPYIYLSLTPSWQAFDNRYQHIASSLGVSSISVWWRVKLPLLKHGIIFASIIGISVSLTQYLPTLILGAGRIATITTEAVAVTSGQDRRIMAVYGLMQALLPLILIVGSSYYSLRFNKEDNVTDFR